MFLNKKLDVLENYSFSEVFTEDNSVFLLYKHKTKKSQPLNLVDNWVEIEFFVLNNKRFALFYDWIEETKKEIYVKTFLY